MRPGYALPAAIATLAALSLLMVGSLHLAKEELQIARARVAAIRARIAAESAVRGVLGAWPAELARALAVGETVALETPAADLPGDASGSVELEKLDATRFIIRGTGRVPGAPGQPPATYRIAAIAGMLDPDEVRRAFPAALAAPGGGRLERGSRVAGAPESPAEGEDAGAPADTLCDAAPGSGLVMADAAGWHDDGTASVHGAPPVLVDPGFWGAEPPNAFLALAAEELAWFADLVVEGTFSPGPPELAGECEVVHAGDGAGAGSPGSPCEPRFPVIVAPGDLTVTGGEGEGLLVVGGDLTLTGGARFVGAIVVHGRFVADSATVTGAVTLTAATPVARLRGARIEFDPCAVSRVVEGAGGLQRPFLYRGRSWLPLF